MTDRHRPTIRLTLLSLACALRWSGAQATPPAPAAAQNPSPMVEATREHGRLTPKTLAGTTRSIAADGKAVELFVPAAAHGRDTLHLVVHFHGAPWLVEQAVTDVDPTAVVAVLNLGAGSATYDRAFANPASFDSLVAALAREASMIVGAPIRFSPITLIGYSAGHGAVRAILREPRYFARVGAVLLLDGMHTSYVPEQTGLAAGGTLDTTNLVAFREFARAAVRGTKRFVVTHSEIFPGTFASTTETADWLLVALGLRRTPVLRWGPRGMQQLSEVTSGRFELLGFAGNSAPDHVDQLHALPEMLRRTLER
jgi:hypothetical protein